MGTIKSFTDIKAWQKARAFCKWAYYIIENTPLKYNYKLRDQFDDSTGSMMDNIAEGFERFSKKEFIQFLTYAKGSCGEAHSQLYRILDRSFIDESTFQEKSTELTEISKMIHGFINYLKNSELKGWRFKEPEEGYEIDLNENFDV